MGAKILVNEWGIVMTLLGDIASALNIISKTYKIQLRVFSFGALIG